MFKFIKKYFSIIFVVLFIVIFSVFNKDEFIKNYEQKVWKIGNNQDISKNINEFWLEDISEINNANFFYTPNKSLLDKIVWEINNAQNRVYVEVYMFTETRIRDALVKAYNRGVDVKVVLEKNPYMANRINIKHYDFLKKAWIDIVWSNSNLYALNHAKFMIIDNEIILSTWNFTYSTFVFNRDLFLFFSDEKILKYFEKLFIWDYSGKEVFVFYTNLVLSPSYSRDKFEKLFIWAKSSLDLYFQYLSDSRLENLLIEKAKEWVKIRIVVSENFYNDEKAKIKFLEKHRIEIKMLDKYTMHSKAILVDKKYLFIWSVNFSSYSLDENRETGLLFTNWNIINQFIELFNTDFK